MEGGMENRGVIAVNVVLASARDEKKGNRAQEQERQLL
jgi:hypothetical protein